MKGYPILKKNIIYKRIQNGNVYYGVLTYFNNQTSFEVNSSCDAVVSLINGKNSIDDIINDLSCIYNNSREDLISKIENLLNFLVNKNLIEINQNITKNETIPRSIITNYDFETLIFQITERCNLNCIHCFAYKKNKSKDIEFLKTIDIIDQFYNIGGVNLTLTGGEPILRKDIIEIINHATSKPLRVTLLTNGVLLNENIIKELKSVNINSVQISLDGSKPEIHDNFRRYKGAFEKSTAAIELLRKYSINVQIASVFNKYNIHDSKNLVNLCIDRWNIVPSFSSQMPEGRALTEGKKFQMTLSEFVDYEIDIKKQISRKLNSNMFEHKFVKEDLTKYYRCKAGVNSLSIDNDGSIKPCIDMKEIIGNVHNDNLYEVWNSDNPILAFCRNNFISKVNLCNECKHVFYCGNGCMLEAKRAWGDYQWPDIHKCLYYKRIKELMDVKEIDGNSPINKAIVYKCN